MTERADIWMPDWTDRPYWLDGVSAPVAEVKPLPSRADVVIVGSGYTGLNAALECARGGRETVVLEAGTPGFGCSTRNGGQISTSIKPSLAALAAKHGAERAKTIRDEGKTALRWIGERIADEKIDCAFSLVGRFHAAHSPEKFREQLTEVETLKREGITAHPVTRAEQHDELGTDMYHGGLVFPDHASLDPGRYHRGLLRRAIEAKVQVHGQCKVTSIARDGDSFVVSSERGSIIADKVILATNGYTTGLTPWMQRRVIPIGSYIIATEPLPKELMDRLCPTNRVISDTRKVVYYYRPSPDRTRILFGGRVSAGEVAPTVSGPRLYEDMCRIFPELRGYRISHSWMGTVAYTFDELPHVGVHEGIYYAMGYCGSGVSLSSYLGMRLGQQVLGLAEGATGFDGLPFPTRPLYTGKPWFLPAAVAWYRWRDRRQYERAKVA